MIELDDTALLEELAEVFTGQIRGWRAGGGIGTPLLVLASDVLPPKRGRCLSCGCPTTPGWRCDQCVLAIELALELADLEGERLVPPAPIINPVVLAIEDAARERDLWRVESKPRAGQDEERAMSDWTAEIQAECEAWRVAGMPSAGLTEQVEGTDGSVFVTIVPHYETGFSWLRVIPLRVREGSDHFAEMVALRTEAIPAALRRHWARTPELFRWTKAPCMPQSFCPWVEAERRRAR